MKIETLAGIVLVLATVVVVVAVRAKKRESNSGTPVNPAPSDGRSSDAEAPR